METWVVSPLGCPPGRNGISTSLPCNQSRGFLFDTAQSSSWASIGNYSLGFQADPRYSETALYGTDTVALDCEGPVGQLTIVSQVVASFAAENYYLGFFGLAGRGSVISNIYNSSLDYNSSLGSLQTMWDEGMIPSMSWAYTAGASYSESRFFFDKLSESHYNAT